MRWGDEILEVGEEGFWRSDDLLGAVELVVCLEEGLDLGDEGGGSYDPDLGLGICEGRCHD